eukprot:8646381-Heterocapsa_arctica.AAC.1
MLDIGGSRPLERRLGLHLRGCHEDGGVRLDGRRGHCLGSCWKIARARDSSARSSDEGRKPKRGRTPIEPGEVA